MSYTSDDSKFNTGLLNETDKIASFIGDDHSNAYVYKYKKSKQIKRASIYIGTTG